MASRARSTVTFELDEDDKGVVQLTVVHDGFVTGSSMLEGISAGWPAVLESRRSRRR